MLITIHAVVCSVLKRGKNQPQFVINEKTRCIMLSEETKAKRKKAYEKIKNRADDITLSDCKNAIAHNERIINKIPDQFLTDELLRKYLENKGSRLKYIPNNTKTESICLLAVMRDPLALEYVPNDILINVMYKAFIQTNRPYSIPQTYRTIENYIGFLFLTKFSKQFIKWLTTSETPRPQNEYDIYSALSWFASHYLKEDSFNTTVKKRERELCIRKTLETQYDRDINQFLVTEKHFWWKETSRFDSFDEFYQYLDGDLNNSNLTELNFSEKDMSRYNFDGAHLCSEILIKQGRYDNSFYKATIEESTPALSWQPVLQNETIDAQLITHSETYSEKLNTYDRKIFYITDIHLNYRLKERFPHFATYDEIRFFIQKYVRNLTKTADDKTGYLLIGGDVSFSFDISKIFYEELCKCWHPSHIIVVLGNHELWDYQCSDATLKSPSVDDIIERYRSMFQELKITFLQNSLLVGYSVLTEADILSQSIDELRKHSLSSSLIVFGGIGFSAYNPNFNATHGVYRQTITTLQDDIKYTQKSEEVYQKLVDTFLHDSLIVLSHMPLADWNSRLPIPNWIYINGHTHRNHCEQSDKCTIYADNQMGYHSRYHSLKYFKTTVLHDIFKYYPDGIYHISKDQYLDFNAGNKIYCTFRRDVDYITMLKRQGVYLFLLEEKENNKLFLLNGGVKNKLKITDVNYYYNNMVKYSDFIKVGVRKYNEALKNISAIIKNIGGDGTIHGCIVDISFYNHIYLNPQDGTISAYYSPTFGERFEYSTVEQLLEVHMPLLLNNYQKLINSSNSVEMVTDTYALPNITQHILDTKLYKPSNLIKRLQYITESNVIRLWSDDIVRNSFNCIIDDSLLPL